MMLLLVYNCTIVARVEKFLFFFFFGVLVYSIVYITMFSGSRAVVVGFATIGTCHFIAMF